MVVAANALISVTPGLMIWTIVCFLIALWVLKRYAFGPIQKMIDDRRAQIRGSLEEAEKARENAQRFAEEARSERDQARVEADQIRAETRREAEAQLERMMEKIEADRQRRLEDTHRRIEAETQRALGQIRAEVGELTVVATSKVTGKVLDSEDHRRLIDEAISELDFSVLEEAAT
jgi:F-type H+-transporting ATPase subunit b